MNDIDRAEKILEEFRKISDDVERKLTQVSCLIFTTFALFVIVPIVLIPKVCS